MSTGPFHQLEFTHAAAIASVRHLRSRGAGRHAERPGHHQRDGARRTIACAGATTPAAVAGLKKMGYASIINLRQASEPGADIEQEAAEAKAAGINFIHLPFNAASPDPTVVDNFLKTVTAPANQPAFVHCASANRAAAMWMIKRMQVDKWDADRTNGTRIAPARKLPRWA
ncbi:MAG: hypothetical protein DMF92_03475 [Acidobacteria bacterium]|nr:MAG: hypothetical protein DMF92_03475 [Acidobacteriota bacterium]